MRDNSSSLKDKQKPSQGGEKEGRARPLTSVERDDEAARSRFDLVHPRRCSSCSSQGPWEHDLASSLAGKSNVAILRFPPSVQQ